MTGVKGQVQQRGVERRQAIVDAAIELFSTTGFRGTGLAAIAARVGITSSAVLHHFGSKERLLEAVVRERDERAGAPLRDFWRSRSLEAIRDGYLWLARDIEAHRELAALHTVLAAENLNAGDPLHEFFTKRARAVRSGTRRMLQRLQGSGEVGAAVDVGAVADEIIAFQEGAQLVWLQDLGRLSLHQMYEHFFSALIRRLAPS